LEHRSQAFNSWIGRLASDPERGSVIVQKFEQIRRGKEKLRKEI
jgi:hypothetical protein